MRLPRPKTLFLPVLGLLAVALVLATVVTVTTYVMLDRARGQTRHVLESQATAIVSGLAAGLRTGWRYWIWQPESLQGLVQEMSRSGDVTFITLLDERGLILAHSDRELLGTSWATTAETLDRLDSDQVEGWLRPDGTYVAGRRLRPDEIKPPGMGQHWNMMRRMPPAEPPPRPEIILVGLKTVRYFESQRGLVQHALILGALLFFIGLAALYFIFVHQNYRTIERTLSDLNSYTAGIVDNMPNGLIALDPLGEPVMVNRAARELFGWADKPERALNREAVIGALSHAFRPVLQQGNKVLEVEFEAPTATNDLLPLAVSAALVPAETGSGLVFILRDLRQIRSLEDQVRQSEKLAAVGRLAAGIAHEVRNPLSSMRGLARFLARGLDESSREAEYLKVMVEEIDRLNRVVTSLLDFARPRQPETAPVDLNEVARHTTSLILDDARAQGVSLREDMAPRPPRIMADRDQAIQAMLNLLLNALEAMPEGGRLTVGTKKNADCGLFLVEDTGPGIPVQDRSQLIDPFFTTKKKGTGLGLTQVATIMEAHHGRLEIAGEPGMGARISLAFPLAPDQEVAKS